MDCVINLNIPGERMEEFNKSVLTARGLTLDDLVKKIIFDLTELNSNDEVFMTRAIKLWSYINLLMEGSD